MLREIDLTSHLNVNSLENAFSFFSVYECRHMIDAVCVCCAIPFDLLQTSLRALGFTPDEIKSVNSAVAAVLMLGQLNFVDQNDRAVIATSAGKVQPQA